MKWVDKMLNRHREPPVVTHVVNAAERLELAEARREHKRLLSRADEAIKEAMGHADDIFGVYRGPERRRIPR